MPDPISPKKQQELTQRMSELGIEEADLEEQFLRAAGPGGQKVNKTSAAVRLLHKPSGIEVRCQKSRSQAQNRFLARRMLADKIEAKITAKKTAAQKLREKIRRQKRKRSKRAKEKILHDKRLQSEKKALRKVPKGE